MTSTSEGSGRSVEGMDNRTEVRDFLASRRARLGPDALAAARAAGRAQDSDDLLRDLVARAATWADH